jgi:hypothetical protein
MWETAWAEAALARRFVERLTQIPAELLRPAVPPSLDTDPYLSAWANVQAALGAAPPIDRDRIGALTTELDARLVGLPVAPEMAEAARRAVRALVARRWLATPESFTFMYEPFESVIPLHSLDA